MSNTDCFKKWQKENKDICDKKNHLEQYVIHLTDSVISDLQTFRTYSIEGSKSSSIDEVNRLINKMARIRTTLRSIGIKASK